MSRTIAAWPSSGSRTGTDVESKQPASSSLAYALTLFLVDTTDGSLVWSVQHSGEAKETRHFDDEAPIPETCPLLRDIVIQALAALPE